MPSDRDLGTLLLQVLLALLVIAHVHHPEYEEYKINDQLGEVLFKRLAQHCLGTKAMTESSVPWQHCTL